MSDSEITCCTYITARISRCAAPSVRPRTTGCWQAGSRHLLPMCLKQMSDTWSCPALALLWAPLVSSNAALQQQLSARRHTNQRAILMTVRRAQASRELLIEAFYFEKEERRILLREEAGGDLVGGACCGTVRTSLQVLHCWHTRKNWHMLCLGLLWHYRVY